MNSGLRKIKGSAMALILLVGAAMLSGTVVYAAKTASAEIHGTVQQVTGFSDATGYTTDTYYTGDKKNNKCDANVNISAPAEQIPLKGSKVNIKSSNSDTVDVTVNVKSDGSFSYTGALADGAYAVTALTAEGTPIGGAQTITISKGVSDKSANFVLDDRIIYTFQTDIKDFKDDILVMKDGKEVFRLLDKTYHYQEKPAGAVSDIARRASVMHRVKMPAGAYSLFVVKPETDESSKRYTISASESSGISTLDITQRGASMLYLIPKVNETVIESAKANAEKIGYVRKGVYKFTPSASPAGTVINHSLGGVPTKDYIAKDMCALGIKGTDTQYKESLMVNGNNYIVFKIKPGDEFVTKIAVTKQSYILADVNYTRKIEGRDEIAIDSRYSNITLTLGEGTYVLYTTAENEGYVNSIEFNYASPFNVINSVPASRTAPNGAKMIIGAFDTTNNIEDYSSFAIMISANKEALEYSSINNEHNEVVQDNDNNLSAEETKNLSVMNVQYDTMGTNTATVIIDETTTLFQKVVDASGVTVAETIDDDYFYHSTKIDNISGTLYAVGAAKRADEPDGKWMVQTDVFTIQ